MRDVYRARCSTARLSSAAWQAHLPHGRNSSGRAHTNWYRNLFAGIDNTPEVPPDAHLLMLEGDAKVPAPCGATVTRLESAGLDRTSGSRGIAIVPAGHLTAGLFDLSRECASSSQSRPVSASSSGGHRHDHQVRQPLCRPCRPRQRRLRRHAHQRSALLQRAPGHRAEQGRVHGQADGRARLQHLLDGRASFPARRHRVHPQRPDDGAAPRAPHQEPQDRLRLQHRADVAPAAAGGGLRRRRHPHRRPHRLRRRARLSHPRGRDLRLPAASTRRPTASSSRSRSTSSSRRSTTTASRTRASTTRCRPRCPIAATR